MFTNFKSTNASTKEGTSRTSLAEKKEIRKKLKLDFEKVKNALNAEKTTLNEVNNQADKIKEKMKKPLSYDELETSIEDCKDMI